MTKDVAQELRSLWAGLQPGGCHRGSVGEVSDLIRRGVEEIERLRAELTAIRGLSRNGSADGSLEAIHEIASNAVTADEPKSPTVVPTTQGAAEYVVESVSGGGREVEASLIRRSLSRE